MKQTDKRARGRRLSSAAIIGAESKANRRPHGERGAEPHESGVEPAGARVAQHDGEGFGGCTNIGECAASCPKEIPLDVISQLNTDLRKVSGRRR